MARNPDSARISPGLVDLGLFASTTAYAIFLWVERRKPRPHTTFIKVIVGDAMCLAAGSLRSRLTGMEHHEGNVIWSFVVGGTPIVIGELSQWLERHVEFRESEERDADPAPPGWE